MDEGRPISYMALAVGTPVLSSNNAELGTVEHVLQIPEEDLFDGIAVKTKHGLRFVDRDQIADITTTLVRCSLTDEEAANLPAPKGTLVLHPDTAVTKARPCQRDSGGSSDGRSGRNSSSSYSSIRFLLSDRAVDGLAERVGVAGVCAPSPL